MKTKIILTFALLSMACVSAYGFNFGYCWYTTNDGGCVPDGGMEGCYAGDGGYLKYTSAEGYSTYCRCASYSQYCDWVENQLCATVDIFSDANCTTFISHGVILRSEAIGMGCIPPW
jgi:hypothetical protein